MSSSKARIETRNITDWNSFHSIFKNALGFPDYYGQNMDAWIDCMTYLDDPELGMTSKSVNKGKLFILEIADSSDFSIRLPELFNSLIECSAFVNTRRIEIGEMPVLALVLF